MIAKTFSDIARAEARLACAFRSRLASLLGAAMLIVFAFSAAADYQAGLNAYSNGDYESAMKEWLAITNGAPAAVNPLIFAEAHYAVARLYWQGEGVPQDFARAREWLEKAAGYGHAGAMGKLGYLYTDGIGVAQDFDTAFAWYSKAAQKGDVDGLYNLGIFYLNGWGVEQNVTRAKSYLAAASAQGDLAAEDALQRLLAEDAERRSGSKPPAAEQPALSGEGSPEGVSAPTAKAVASKPGPAPASQADPPLEVPSAATAESDVVVNPSLPDNVIHDEDWILAQDPDHYTIQAIGMRERATVEGLVDGLEALAPWAMYVTQRATRPIHVLIQGVYEDVDSARAARDRFPRQVNRPDRVWIRRFEKIQDIIRADRRDASAAMATPAAGSTTDASVRSEASRRSSLPRVAIAQAAGTSRLEAFHHARGDR